MKEITNNYHLEYEYQALQEVVSYFNGLYEQNEELHNRLRFINKKILKKFKENNIPSVLWLFTSQDKDLVKLFNSILNELIYTEPILARVFIYNSTLPEDLLIRKRLKDYLPDEAINFLHSLFYLDLLIDSRLAQNLRFNDKPVKGIHLRSFVVGKIIDGLLSDFKHFRLIDIVKIAGAQESIEKLRDERVYKTDEGLVFDYSPLFKEVLTNTTIIREVFNEDHFKNSKYGADADEVICDYIQKTQYDNRKDECFGNNLDTSKIKTIIRYKGQEREIPLQLLPKYKNLIKKAGEITLTNLSEDGGFKEDEKQEAMIGLLKGAMTYDKDKGTVAGWLKKNVTWGLGNAFDEQSTEALKNGRTKKRILKEEIDSFGGSLDEPINEDDREDTRKDNIPDKNNLSPMDELIEKDELKDKESILSEIYQKEPRMRNIIEKEENGISLTDNERQIKKRTIDKFK